jgi:SAM-dependent methyltransferase
VLDLAAGTGKLTASLAARGHDVTAVEPLPGMRARLAADLPGVRALEGRAERIPAADGAFDVVCVAQAFHWFEPRPALDELARVLVPGGLLVLLWNLWDLDEPVPALIEQIVAPLETGPIQHPTTGNHRYGTWSDALERDPRFGPAELRQARHAVALDADGAAARVASMSQVQAAAPAARDAAIEAARRAVACIDGGWASFAYVAEIEIRRRA